MSKKVLYDEQKDQNSLLSMINACVSHELRNPLNSIDAQNNLKQKLYEKICKILQDSQEHEISTAELSQRLSQILHELEDGL